MKSQKSLSAKEPLLVLDVHYLCHRAFYSQGELSWKGIATGVIFGFLKSIALLKDEFMTDRIAFCFDSTNLKRCEMFSEYKHKRRSGPRPPPSKELEAMSNLKEQIAKLRRYYLPRIGFKNIFRAPGYESDDLMAAIVANSAYDRIILVTDDSDMYQCISRNVSVYSPRKQVTYDLEWFKHKYGIQPKEWSMMRAISGCHTDNVPGIPGVGEITALKYLRHELPEKSKSYKTIESLEGKAIILRNLGLVALPFFLCPVPEIREDVISVEGWKAVCSELGMKTLSGHPPVLTRRLFKYMHPEIK